MMGVFGVVGVCPMSLLLMITVSTQAAVTTHHDTGYKSVMDDGDGGWVTVSSPTQDQKQESGQVWMSLPSMDGVEAMHSRRYQLPSVSTKNNSMASITGQLGGSAFLPCTTHHSMERQVSWMRRRDFHILTSGSLTYTKEGRFQVHHQEGSTHWTLAIKYLILDDDGVYECHISTGGGVVAQLVRLHVVEPKAVIPGTGVYHVQAGSTISLTCYIEQSPEPPQYIFWYHEGRMINYDKGRGGVNVKVEDGGKVRSRLSLNSATPDDSGNYTCDAANTRQASISVFVTQANHIAAIQPRAMDGASGLKCARSLLLLALILALKNATH